ncbi:hypothetical protein MPTK1_1g14260 [Marchantia polymorpha subsp. ruderalis]|uniref:DUF7953 domain-containing protein n=2 Tax=Marchantia polymorpha TaxID=3197 RepID=A0AAF6AQ15_MARPO|nr:hypothetical protein MARPO_0179s0007 [Marchantia polymorpha]BBM98535.1 hypothetical protein Mp_1g14260 [Marchantia polymorpha subsp. ruderalis]|eukprot:PTQ27917.1 hypothetical protein MARPO_0179s0007 [Marchantia polymorpha]
MGAAVTMNSCIASRTERQWMEKVVPNRIARTGFLLCVLLPLITLLLASGVGADGNVTVESIILFKTHEWFGRKPTVYFQCLEEQKVYLPDVVEKNAQYSFLGQESWQPLTTLYGAKCKRCGIYEEDTVKADDTFFEWELCPKAFTSPDGRYEVIQENEFNATFICKDCIPQRWSKRCARWHNSMQIMEFELRQQLPISVPAFPAPVSGTDGQAVKTESEEDEEKDEKGAGLAFLIIVLVFVVLVGLGVVAYTKWRQKQRAEQQANFIKLFEDKDDDLDELYHDHL